MSNQTSSNFNNYGYNSLLAWVHKSKLNLLSIVLFSLLFLLFGYQTYKIAFVKQWPDFGIYIAASKQLLSGLNPYLRVVHGGYIYPLTLSYILIPLTFINSYISQFIWYILSVGCYVYTTYTLAQLLNIPPRNQLLITLIVTILFVSIIQDDLIHSNINLIILALTISALKYVISKRVYLGLIFLALATSIKLSPIVLTLWIVLYALSDKRNIKNGVLHLLLFFAFVLTFTAIIPYLIHGNVVVTWYEYYYNNFLLEQMKYSGVSKYNFTLAGGINTIFGVAKYPTFSLKLISGVLLCIFPAIIALIRKGFVASYLLCLQIIPLTGTNGEQHHLVFLIPAVFYMLNLAYNIKPQSGRITSFISGKFFKYFVLGIAICQLLILWGNNVPNIPLEMFGLVIIYTLTFCFAFNESKLKVS